MVNSDPPENMSILYTKSRYILIFSPKVKHRISLSGMQEN